MPIFPPAAPAPTPGPHQGYTGDGCDGHSVGVLIHDPDGRVLIGERTDGVGIAPVAGHVYDEHGSYPDAAVAETAEETGLRIATLAEVYRGWRPNRCRRGDGPNGPGHHWIVYVATATGDLDVDSDSYFRMWWADGAELARLVARTGDYAAREQQPNGQRR